MNNNFYFVTNIIVEINVKHNTITTNIFFQEWLAARNKSTDFENLSATELNELLRGFYGEVRLVNGQYYGKSSYIGIRSSLNRYLKDAPHNKMFDIQKDREFQSSNHVFLGCLRKLKSEGKDKTQHKAAITDEDWHKLEMSGVLSSDNPDGLQKRVFINLMLHFGRRGQEGLSDLIKDKFVVGNIGGKKYIKKAFNEMKKTKQGTDMKEDHKDPIMME